MILLTYKEYRLEYFESDKFLNLKADRLKKKNNNELSVKVQLVWTDHSFDFLKLYYNFLLLFFFFEQNCYLQNINYGRLDKQSFFIINFFMKLSDYTFLNFFFFDLLRFYFYSKENFFENKYYKVSVTKKKIFLKISNFDLFVNKRLSQKMPVFFPRLNYPLKFYIDYSNLFFFKNKLLKHL